MIDDLLGYKGERVIVTGGSSGMGLAAVNILRKLGAEVWVLDRQLGADADKTRFCEVDIRDPLAIDRAIAQVGPVRRLFNCAGVQLTPEPLDTMLVNFIGLRHLTERVLATMGRGGAVGTITSIVGEDCLHHAARLTELVTTPDFLAGIAWSERDELATKNPYVVSKQAASYYTIRRAWQVAPSGIRMNAVAPGPTLTPMLQETIDVMGKELVDRVPRPLGSTATAEDQAWPLVLLTSNLCAQVTGQVVHVDGGLACGLRSGLLDPSIIGRW